MTKNNLLEVFFGTLFACLIVFLLGFWTEFSPDSLAVLCYEDGIVENVTALLFGVSSLGFVIMLGRSEFLRSKPRIFSLFTVGWILFAFLIMGEEISWGQRLFGFATPETVKAYNHQDEFNIHNLTVGGFTLNSRRVFNLLTFVIAAVFPVLLFFERGRRLVGRLGMPVMPLWCAPLCLGSFTYIKYFAFQGENFTNEVRELIFALSIFLFAIYGAIRPDKILRTK